MRLEVLEHQDGHEYRLCSSHLPCTWLGNVIVLGLGLEGSGVVEGGQMFPSLDVMEFDPACRRFQSACEGIASNFDSDHSAQDVYAVSCPD